ncbi:MAG: ABC transporter substrate-binding protein, partial [Cryobacterium sp.]
TNVAQIFQRSGTLQVSDADSGIESVADFEGKKIGSWGFGNEWEIFAAMAAEGLDASSVEIVTQDFNMNAFLQGDIDAAQAMTYNEYAQVLETINPDTGELYQPDELNVIDWNDEGTAMLQDAIWANTDKLADDEAYADQTVAFIKASIKGWIFAAQNPEDAATIVADAGSALPAGHQLWMTNEVSKLIFPSTNGVGLIDEAAWANTVDIAMNTKNETGGTIITTDPPETAYSNEYVQKALDELTADGVDVIGADWTPIDVTLQEGGE